MSVAGAPSTSARLPHGAVSLSAEPCIASSGIVSAPTPSQIALIPRSSPAAVCAGAAGCEISSSLSIAAAFAGSDEKSLFDSASAGAHGVSQSANIAPAICSGGTSATSAAPDSRRPASFGAWRSAASAATAPPIECPNR